ncbi:hypothetical protein [Cohnella rhizosphaerae]|uniref:Uncharacterized protein n=1 Tax=Cohnella rhizosphaerae TaxID=1457232 RepID=A0A9X4KS66_9BACL|nr:hypothetical protein [Cohnella rhizosphaerae]MDG0810171.1 hypothetical protein [Cohnella rhizosphaerae]
MWLSVSSLCAFVEKSLPKCGKWYKIEFANDEMNAGKEVEIEKTVGCIFSDSLNGWPVARASAGERGDRLEV